MKENASERRWLVNFEPAKCNWSPALSMGTALEGGVGGEL